MARLIVHSTSEARSRKFRHKSTQILLFFSAELRAKNASDPRISNPAPTCLALGSICNPQYTYSPAVLKLEEGARDGKLSQFYLGLADKDDKFLVVFAFIKLGLLEVRGGRIMLSLLLC